MEGNKGCFRDSSSEVMQLSGYDSTDQGTLWSGDLGEKRVGRADSGQAWSFFLGEWNYIWMFPKIVGPPNHSF